jgi:hypothetical protein
MKNPKMLNIEFRPTAQGRRVLKWVRFFEDEPTAAIRRAELAVLVEYPGAHGIAVTVATVAA